MAPRRTTSSPAEYLDPELRWRPRDRRGGVCGYTFRGDQCDRRGAHYCRPRASRPVRFFAELLVHTKGPAARTAFRLEPFQEFEIVRPIFGEVLWDTEHRCYVRRYRLAYIFEARKNGKSELAAGIQLYLLVGDDEEASEVYSAAKDTKQAGMVFEPAKRMVQLSPVLGKRLRHLGSARRIIDERTASFYEVLTADAAGELGRNPHGFNLDEVLSQPDGSLWEAMTTAAGTRLQELMFATSTETNDSASFGAEMIDEAERIEEDPARSPHSFAYVRKLPANDEQLARIRRLHPGHPHLPVSTDPWDERNWKWPNPGLDLFKSRLSMRRQAVDAKSNPEKENGFRQFQMNERVQQVTRYIPLDLWDENVGARGLMLRPRQFDSQLEGMSCRAGLDLSSKLDLTAWSIVFEDGTVRWRYWVPETVTPVLSAATDGLFEKWVRAGWITETDGSSIDYEQLYADITADAERFSIPQCVYDKWCGEPVRQRIEADTGMQMVESSTSFERMTAPMTEAMRLLTLRAVGHGGDPVARWMADALSVKRPRDDPDRLRPVKQDRAKTTARIDGMPAWFFAIDGWLISPAETGRSAYEDDDLEVI